tara:strand:- start:32 stop:340 length:309 start_codon:yes stop_codon:yes gene_type:complete
MRARRGLSRAARSIAPARTQSSHLDLTLRDDNRTIADLPKRFSTQGPPDGVRPATDDMGYFAPWRNIALYYRNFGYSNGPRRIDGDLSALISKFHSSENRTN